MIVFWMLTEPVNAPARWWPCACLKCVSGLWRLEKLDLFDMDTCLWPDAQIFFRHKWKKLTTAFLFTSVYWRIQLPRLLEWVSCICVSGFILKFSRIVLLRKRLQLGSKTDLITNGVIFVFFCWYMPRIVDFMSAWTKICRNCSKGFLFWRHRIFSIVWRVFSSVL